MGGLQIMKVRFVNSNGFLKLFYVFSAALPKGSLSLTIALFTFF